MRFALVWKEVKFAPKALDFRTLDRFGLLREQIYSNFHYFLINTPSPNLNNLESLFHSTCAFMAIDQNSSTFPIENRYLLR